MIQRYTNSRLLCFTLLYFTNAQLPIKLTNTDKKRNVTKTRKSVCTILAGSNVLLF